MDNLYEGIQHACCVDFDGNGLLILGKSGSGKSSLAIACMGLGAVLVGDDYVTLKIQNKNIIAISPPNIAGLIEVPKVGILKCDYKEQTKLVLAIDVSRGEINRLPVSRSIKLKNCGIPLIYGARIPHLHSVAYQLIKGGLSGI